MHDDIISMTASKLTLPAPCARLPSWAGCHPLRTLTWLAWLPPPRMLTWLGWLEPPAHVVAHCCPCPAQQSHSACGKHAAPWQSPHAAHPVVHCEAALAAPAWQHTHGQLSE